MERPDATWHAVYHIRQDLTQEKMELLDEMRHYNDSDYWAGADDFRDAAMKVIMDRIAEINIILNNINNGFYKL